MIYAEAENATKKLNTTEPKNKLAPGQTVRMIRCKLHLFFASVTPALPNRGNKVIIKLQSDSFICQESREI